MLSPKSSAQHYLSKFLGAVESYLHPANSGKWVGVISEVAVQLPKYLFDRLVYERYKPHPWKRAVPGKKQHKYDASTVLLKSHRIPLQMSIV